MPNLSDAVNAGGMSPAPSPTGLDRYRRALTLAAVVAVLVVGFLLIRNYRRTLLAETARQELDRVLTLPGGPQLAEGLEQIAATFSGTPIGPEIRYRLGCAYRNLGRIDDALRTLSQVEQEAPGSSWDELAAEARRQIAREQESRNAVAERIRTLESSGRAQQAFWNPDGTDARDSRLPVPRRPDTAAGTEPDPRLGTALEKP
jgi:hypothetical protein